MGYEIRESVIKNIFTGEAKSTKFEVRNTDNGNLYATLDNKVDADVVVFGLNNNFIQHSLGGFADNVVVEIKKAIRGEDPAAWAIAK